MLAVTAKTEVAPAHPQLRADGRSMSEQGRRGLRVTTHRRPAGTEDSRLLEADGVARAAEIIHVIKRNAGHQRAIRVEHIDRIETPTEADFEDDDLRLCRAKYRPCGQRAVLEVGQRRVTTRGLDRSKAGDQRVVCDVLAVEADPFVVVQQMGRGVAADPIAFGEQDGLEHRAARTLAIGAADRDHDGFGVGSKSCAHFGDTLEPELNGLRVTLLEQFQPPLEGERQSGVR